MKKLFLLAWPIALAAVSCSNEEVVSVNNDANEIKFSVVAENATRAQNVFCNVKLPTEFHVWAAVGGKQYFEKVQYKKDASGAYTAKGGEVHFWPAEAVDFYAVTEENTGTPTTYYDWATPTATHKFNWNAAGSSTITWETRSTDAPAQTDLLYAYTKKSRTDADANGKVGINFRHALSQIVFKALNVNPTIKVAIDQVEVVNVSSKGTFTMPSTVTDNNVEDHTTEATAATVGVGSWTGLNTTTTYTTTKFTSPITVAYDGSVSPVAVNLTDETGSNDDPKSHNLNKHSLLLIPQTTTAWNRATETAPTSSAGTYFKVHCIIWNVSGVDGGADLPLWATKTGEGVSAVYSTKAVYIPVAAAWEPGKKYIYTFKFGSNTTGGYEDDGDPVLVPISFSVTVDDFAEVTDETIWMGPDETPAP